MTSAIKTSVIVPAYNEERGIVEVLDALFKVIDETFEVIVVDDGSSDRTAAAARPYPCRLISHPQNCGKGRAMQTGIAAASGENIIFIDADGTYPVETIPEIAAALDAHDLVIASRSQGQDHIPAFNRVGNSLLRSIIRNLYGFKARDPFTGLYGVSKENLQKMKLVSAGFGIEAEIAIKAARMGLKILDVSILYQPRVGEAKLAPLRDGYRILKTIFTLLFLYNPTLSFILPGTGLLAFGSVLTLLLLLGPLRLGGIAFGVHTMMVAAILGLLGLQVIVFGVAAKLYALAHRFTVPDGVTKAILRPGVRKGLAGLGAAAIVAGFALGLRLLLDWAHTGFGTFSATSMADLVLFLTMFGVQVLFSVGFLSIFVVEVDQHR